MSSSLDYLELCRLCLVKDRVSVPIFEDEGDVRQIFLKITACLPVKVSREDKLPKKICDDCVYKVELFYQFWNTTANAEKQLLQWLGEVGGLEDKQGYVTEVLDTNVMKQERSSDSRLDGSVMQVGGHQNSMDMGMMDIITMPAGSEQQFTSVPMDTSGTVQTVQVVPGPSTQTTHDQMAQSQTTHLGEESEEENSDDGCDNEEGLPVKEEHEDDQGDQPLETTTFVALPCDEAGPSGLQQQKISEISEMSMQQTADNDPKTGYQKEPPIVMKPTIKSIVILKNPMAITPRRQPQQFECDYCSQSFATYLALALHVRTHTRESYSCNVCDQPEVSAESLREHVVNQQCTPRFNCPECKKWCKNAKGVRIHVARVHNKKPKKKQIKKVLKERNYSCLFCKKKYRSEGYLNGHMVKIHKDVPQTNSYRCEHCDFKTLNKYFMKKHVLIHTGDHKVTCDICEKKMVKSYLAEHMRIHTGEKPYICCYCGKMFGGKKYLTVHERTHTGEKLYQCQLCNKNFAQESSLRVHVLCHTKKNEAVKNET